MSWTIPDKGTGGRHDFQSIVFKEYLDVLVGGINGTDCVLSGCNVTAQGSPDMTCAVAKGAVLANGVLKPVTAGNVTITAAHATLPRIDLVVADSTGAKQVRAGTAAANPYPPTRTANDVALAAIWVPATDTTISSDQITSLRVVRNGYPMIVHRVTTPVTQNNTSNIQTYVTLTLPSGLLAAGRQLRVRCGGNYLSNSGTGTWTLTIAYGGTTMFADATGSTTADADRGAWFLDFMLVGQALNDQALSGRCTFQTPGSKTAPTSGQAGDLGATSHIDTPIAGSAAVDSDTGDRDLTVQWTMSVQNANAETVMEFATVELM